MATQEALIDDLQVAGTTCGNWKCYYKSSSHPGFGYVIGSNSRGRGSWNLTKALTEAYQLAQKLQDSFGLRHFFQSPPITFPCSQTLKDGLNNRQVQLFLKKYGHTGKKPFGIAAVKNKPCQVVVQVVREAPEPNILVQGYYDDFDTFANEVRLVDPFLKNHVANVSKFLEQFRNDWNRTVLAYQTFPKLYRDFQFLLDSEGFIWQLDLDRVNEKKHKKHKVTQQQFEEKLIYPFFRFLKRIVRNATFTNTL